MRKVLGLIMIVSCAVYMQGSALAADPPADSLKGTITISGAWALYPMAVKWASEFQKIHPGVKIDISAGGAGKGIAGALGGVAG